ncbi:MAG TPA: KEOPS complex subunit Pcc1 [Candidatus Nanoarchaeia archaeon]|nr:KEOPS complex subunit Pcc1 [Candidatus Nanoarchaeia archaeon]
MNAKITIPLSKEDSNNTIKALADEITDNERVKVNLKTSKEGLIIEVDADDVIGLKAGVNTYLKLLSVSEEVKTCLKKKPEIK